MLSTEVKIGDVSYHVSRAFRGARTASDLLIDAVVGRISEEDSVDAQKMPTL